MINIIWNNYALFTNGNLENIEITLYNNITNCCYKTKITDSNLKKLNTTENFLNYLKNFNGKLPGYKIKIKKFTEKINFIIGYYTEEVEIEEIIQMKKYDEIPTKIELMKNFYLEVLLSEISKKLSNFSKIISNRIKKISKEKNAVIETRGYLQTNKINFNVNFYVETKKKLNLMVAEYIQLQTQLRNYKLELDYIEINNLNKTNILNLIKETKPLVKEIEQKIQLNFDEYERQLALIQQNEHNKQNNIEI